jgi:hypothetical protein
MASWRRLLERHPLLAKVIEMVVNHTRNRFTTVAYIRSHLFVRIHSFITSVDMMISSRLVRAAVNQMLGRTTCTTCCVQVWEVYVHQSKASLDRGGSATLDIVRVFYLHRRWFVSYPPCYARRPNSKDPFFDASTCRPNIPIVSARYHHPVLSWK